MTPAINTAKKARVTHHVHKYKHDPRSQAYGLEAAEALGLAPAQVFKTLIAELDGQTLAVAIIPVEAQLDMKLLAVAAGAKRADMADPRQAERVTGYIRGGISPIGQKRRLPTFIDAAAQSLAQVYVSAGRRGLEIELSPSDLAALTGASFAPLSRAAA